MTKKEGKHRMTEVKQELTAQQKLKEKEEIDRKRHENWLRRQQKKQEKQREEEERQLQEQKIAQKKHEKYMREAIRQAKKAYALREVPIGCVIVHEDKIIARGYNRRNTDQNTTSHAEMNAIRKASKKLQDWRLEGCTMYITLEPCQMCAGAIVQARVSKVVIGSMNPKAGCAGSVLNLLEMEQFNHQVDVTRGVLEEDCSQMLADFFKELREEKKRNKEKKKPVSQVLTEEK